MLNWIYVDKDTYEVKYGLRVDAQPHITGPFDCTRQDRRMTLESWEGFVAVEEFPGVWALYFDHDDDGLVTKVPMGTRVLEVELTRREKKERKPEPDPNQAQTLDEKMKQHKEQTQREEEERQEMLREQQQEQVAANAQTAEEPQQQSIDATDHQPEVTLPASEITLDLGKLKLEVPNAGHLSPHSPSVATDNVSFWSAARKGDGISDTDSVTAASSIVDRNENVEESRTPGYKKPYVEDEPVSDAIEDHVLNST